jgi:hypothetical protein
LILFEMATPGFLHEASNRQWDTYSMQNVLEDLWGKLSQRAPDLVSHGIYSGGRYYQCDGVILGKGKVNRADDHAGEGEANGLADTQGPRALTD